MTDREKIRRALEVAWRSGDTDGAHHKAWVIDQMVRALNGCEGSPELGLQSNEAYAAWVRLTRSGEDGPETYGWDEGIAP